MKNPFESFMKTKVVEPVEKIEEKKEKSPEEVWSEVSQLGKPITVEHIRDSEFEGGRDLKMTKNIPEDLK